MGFLDVFTGANAKDWAQHGTKANIDSLYKGMREAQEYMDVGYNAADQNLDTARADASRNLTDGYLGGKSLLQHTYDSSRANLFRGVEGANTALTQNFQNAANAYTTNSDKASGFLSSALSRANELYDPYIEAGNAAQGRYSNLMGLNGQAAAKSAYDDYYDPTREFRNEQIMDAVNMEANRAGDLGSGRAGLATSRALNESQYRDMENYSNRLERASNKGGEYAGALAGFTTNIQGQQANLAQRRAGDLAGMHTRYGDAIADNVNQVYKDSAGYDRDLGVALNTGANSYYGNLANMDLSVGKDKATNNLDHYNKLAGLAQGTEATIGALHNREAGQIAQANASGVSNILGGITGLAKLFL